MSKQPSAEIVALAGGGRIHRAFKNFNGRNDLYVTRHKSVAGYRLGHDVTVLPAKLVAMAFVPNGTPFLECLGAEDFPGFGPVFPVPVNDHSGPFALS